MIIAAVKVHCNALPSPRGIWRIETSCQRRSACQGASPSLQCHLRAIFVSFSSIAAVQGRIGAWIKNTLGLGPDNLFLSVRFALETALLTLLADLKGVAVTQLITGSLPLAAAVKSLQHPHAQIRGISDPVTTRPSPLRAYVGIADQARVAPAKRGSEEIHESDKLLHQLKAGTGSGASDGAHNDVALNALIGGATTPDESARLALGLVQQGFRTIKIKVSISEAGPTAWLLWIRR